MLFSTHYHALCKIIGEHPDIGLAHMACMVENASVEDPSMENITFLYILTPGLCDKVF
jgi:DNA mismatch repair ATPase MutS